MPIFRYLAVEVRAIETFNSATTLALNPHAEATSVNSLTTFVQLCRENGFQEHSS